MFEGMQDKVAQLHHTIQAIMTQAASWGERSSNMHAAFTAERPAMAAVVAAIACRTACHAAAVAATKMDPTDTTAPVHTPPPAPAPRPGTFKHATHRVTASAFCTSPSDPAQQQLKPTDDRTSRARF